MLHSLHCVNHLRMWLYPETYPHDPVDGITHQAHCIDHLRQLLMCNADLTPVPTQYYPGLERNYINSSRPHTCRDFSRIREWATERFNGSTAVKPRNRDGALGFHPVAYVIFHADSCRNTERGLLRAMESVKRMVTTFYLTHIAQFFIALRHCGFQLVTQYVQESSCFPFAVKMRTEYSSSPAV